MFANFVLYATDDTRRILNINDPAIPRVGEIVTFDDVTYQVEHVEYRYEQQAPTEPYQRSHHSGVWLRCIQTEDSEINVTTYKMPSGVVTYPNPEK